MEKTITILSGGAMRAIWGAGIVTRLQEENLYSRIKEIRASSAGAIEGMYLLSRQTRLGSSIFYQDLIKGFVSVPNFWGGILDRIVRFSLGRDFVGVRDALNLETLFDAVSRKHPDLEVVRTSGIPLWVRVLALDTGEPIYLKFSDHDWVTLLRATVSMIPYVHTPVVINGRAYGDTSMVDPIGFKELRRLYPEEKILVVFCGDPYFKKVSMLKNHIEGMFAHMMYGPPYYSLFASAYERLREDLDAIQKDKRALLVAPPPNFPVLTRTCDPKKILHAYAMGIEAGERAAAFIR